MRAYEGEGLGLVARLLSATLVLILALPLVALATSASLEQITDGLRHPDFAPAFWLSLQTSLITLSITLITGTPLAWWLARTQAANSGRRGADSWLAKVIEALVELPIVIPPAVIGIALLQAFGSQGLFGTWLAEFGVRLPFSRSAVVLAQLVVSAPFFVQAAANGFRKVDPDALLVARTLGASPRVAFFRVALPVALPSLMVGASLAWARALGEFGATLLFAGNLRGATQTLPLAIYTALESDLALALTFSLVLAALGALLLTLLRTVPVLVAARSTRVAEPARSQT